MENAEQDKAYVCYYCLLVFCVIFSKEMPIDSISKVQAQEAKESVLSESTQDESTEVVRSGEQDDASKKSQYVIVLDAGHGGKDEGRCQR